MNILKLFMVAFTLDLVTEVVASNTNNKLGLDLDLDLDLDLASLNRSRHKYNSFTAEEKIEANDFTFIELHPAFLKQNTNIRRPNLSQVKTTESDMRVSDAPTTDSYPKKDFIPTVTPEPIILNDRISASRPNRLSDQWMNRYRGMHYRLQRRLKRQAVNSKSRKLQPEEKKALEIQAYYIHQEMITRCLPPTDPSAVLGHFRIKQSNSFTLKCSKDKTRPLYAFGHWICDSKTTPRIGNYAPTMCIDHKLPRLVTMTRRAILVGLADPTCGGSSNWKVLYRAWNDTLAADKTEHTVVDGFDFHFRNSLGQAICNGSFSTATRRFKVTLTLVFQIRHIPMTYAFKPTTHQKVMLLLDKKATELLVLLKMRKVMKHYVIDTSDVMFKASNCTEPGSAIENNERFFTKDIPPCRICDRGRYLDLKKRMCLQCSRSFYAIQGSTTCLPCPIAQAGVDVSADSLADCYAEPLCHHCPLQALIEGVIIMVTFHLVSLATMVWNLRHALIRIPIQTGKDVVKRKSTH